MLDRFTVTQRLWLTFSAIIGVFVIVGGLVWSNSTKVEDASDKVVNVSQPKAAELLILLDTYYQFRIKTLNNIALTDQQGMSKEYDEYQNKYKQRFEDSLGKLEKMVNANPGSADEPGLVSEIRRTVKPALDETDKVMKLALENKSEQAIHQMLSGARPKLKELETALKAHLEFNQKRNRERGQLVNDLAHEMRSNSLAGSLVAMFLAILLGWIVSNSIRRPLEETVQAMERVANYDLTINLNRNTTHNNELVRLQTATMKMAEALNAMLKDLSLQSIELNKAASSLKEASGQVSIGADRQSEATASMAAALEEMSTSINHVSDLSAEAHRISIDSGRVATEGGITIKTMVNDISFIADSIGKAEVVASELLQASDKISSVTAVIKDVADQTNLLALNAAIEAARAGEQGRGFAVVADEVRKLAERTTLSTSEINAAIGGMQDSARNMSSQMAASVGQVREGMTMANQAGESVEAINSRVDQVGGVVNEVSSALKEQAAASNEIAARVESIVEMIDQTTAAMAAVADTAVQLESLAERIAGDIGKFRVI